MTLPPGRFDSLPDRSASTAVFRTVPQATWVTWQSACMLFPTVASGIVALIVVTTALWGGAINIQSSSIISQYTIATDAALGMLLSAASLVLLHRGATPPGMERGSRVARTIGRLLAGAVVLMSIVALVGYAVHRDFAFTNGLAPLATHWNTRNRLARMPALSAVALGLLGGALASLDIEWRRVRPAVWFATGAGCTVLSVVLLDAYRAFRSPDRALMSFPAAIALLLLAAGVLACEICAGRVLLMTSLGAGGVLIRRMLPCAFLLPLALSVVRASGVSMGLDPQTGDSALLAVLTMLTVGLIIWGVAVRLERADARWKLLEEDRIRLVSEDALTREREQSERRARVVAVAAHAVTELHAVELVMANALLESANLEADDARSIAEATLWEQSTLLMALPDVVLVIDRDGTYIAAPGNPNLLIRPPDELVGRKMHDFLPAGTADLCIATIREVLDTGRKVQLEYTLVIRGKQVWFEGIVSTLGPTAVLWIGRDISTRKHAEANLAQSQKLEAVGQLAGGIAHDFNNMLAVITGYAGMLLKAIPSTSEWHADVVEIMSAADRAAALTRNLLAFGRRQPLAPSAIDLNTIVLGIHSMLRRVLPEDISLVTTLAPALWLVHADAGQIEQVVMNLVVNARDAMLDGGALTIETNNVVLGQDDDPRDDFLSDGRYVALTVRDTGKGMTDAVRDRIFEPFFTTKDVGKGTGLGLSIAHGVVKQSGGHIRIESAPSLGTTVCIYLPRMVESESEDARNTARGPDEESAGFDAVALGNTEPALLMANDGFGNS